MNWKWSKRSIWGTIWADAVGNMESTTYGPNDHVGGTVAENSMSNFLIFTLTLVFLFALGEAKQQNHKMLDRNSKDHF